MALEIDGEAMESSSNAAVTNGENEDVFVSSITNNDESNLNCDVNGVNNDVAARTSVNRDDGDVMPSPSSSSHHLISVINGTPNRLLNVGMNNSDDESDDVNGHPYHELSTPSTTYHSSLPPPLPPRRGGDSLINDRHHQCHCHLSSPPSSPHQCSSSSSGSRPKSFLNKLGGLLVRGKRASKAHTCGSWVGGVEGGGGDAQLAYFLDSVDDDPPPVPPPRSQHNRVNSTDFTQSLRELRRYGWYWGPLKWEEAEKKLMNEAEGSFLVRDSADDRHILALSFSFEGRVRHVRIEHSKGKFSFGDLTDTLGCTTVVEFVEKAMEMSNNGRHLFFLRSNNPGAPPLQVRLLYPISRFISMSSLKHRCRFEILKHVRADHIDLLPLPHPLKYYLKRTQYYVEEHELW